MRNLLSAVVFIWLFVGCKPASEPVTSRPTPTELLGGWILTNSPRVPGNPPVPQPGHSWILLNSNGVVNLTNVLVEEIIVPAGGIGTYRQGLKTGSGVWEIVDRMNFWSVRILFPNDQELVLRINQREGDEFELRYRPDPDMVEPLIFVRAPDTRTTSK